MDDEIAELESFIDSYARDDPNVTLAGLFQSDPNPGPPSGQGALDLSDDPPSGYNFLADFQRELSERQRKEQQLQNIETWNPGVNYPMPQYGNPVLTPAKAMTPQVPVTNYHPYVNENPQAPFGNHQPHFGHPQNYQNPNFPPGPSMEEIYRTLGLYRPSSNQGTFPQFAGGAVSDGWVETAKQPPVIQNTHPTLVAPYQQNMLYHPPNPTSHPSPSNFTNLDVRDPRNVPGTHIHRPQNGFVRGSDDQMTPNNIHRHPYHGDPVHQTHDNNTKIDNAGHRLPSRENPNEGYENPKKSFRKQISPKSNAQQGKSGHKHRPPVARRSSSEENPRIVHYDGKQLQCTKIVSGKSKEEVRNWLQNGGKNVDSVERKMRGLEVAQPKDLPKFVRMTQNYVKTEEKLRQVAEILFNKATKNPKFARNCAILCTEMSSTMIQGTKFRTVILNLMQARFQSREDMIRYTVKNEKDESWAGFVAFLSELYLKLRTASGEKITALVKPLYSCLFLMLKTQYSHPKVSQSFFRTLKLVGLSVEKTDATTMARLMSELRDTVVSPTAMTQDARKHLLQSLELYARSWSTSALDEKYYNQRFQRVRS